jgi:ribosomal 50S subunit-recycling heat shock protein
MRLDLYLKSSRLVIRRTLAQSLCDAGLVLVNAVPAKSSRAVKVGDEIRITRSDRIVTVRVTAIPSTRQTSRASAADLYEVLSEEPDDLGIPAHQE